MDAIEPSADFQGWELLQANSDADSKKSFSEIDSHGFFQVNYFSSEPQISYGADEKLASSDNASWIDPVLEENPVRYLHKESGDFWSDSGSELSENHELTVLDGGNEVGFPEKEKGKLIIGESSEKSTPYMDSAGITAQEALDTETKQNLPPDSNEEGNGCRVVSGSEKEFDESLNKNAKDVEKSSVAWWKMPINFLKYFAFRMSPLCTISFAAAVMGFVILSRRLYRMRNKARASQVKLAVDDKKVSHVMSQAARLNEAFWIVKRVPAIRPALPALGTAPWPVMSLR